MIKGLLSCWLGPHDSRRLWRGSFSFDHVFRELTSGVIPLLPLEWAHQFLVQIPKFSLGVHLWCMHETGAGASMHEGAVLSVSLCVKKVFALSLLGDAWGLPLTATLRAYLSACRRFTFI